MQVGGQHQRAQQFGCKCPRAQQVREITSTLDGRTIVDGATLDLSPLALSLAQCLHTPPSPEGRLPYKAPWDFAGSSLAKDGQVQPHPYRPPPWDFSDYEPPPNETKVHGPLHPPKFTPAMLMPPHLKLEVIKTMRAAKYMAIRVSKALPVVEEAAALASTMGTAAHDLVVSNPHAPSAILGTLRALDGCAVDAEAAMSRRSGELRGLLEALHEWQPVLSETPRPTRDALLQAE